MAIKSITLPIPEHVGVGGVYRALKFFAISRDEDSNYIHFDYDNMKAIIKTRYHEADVKMFYYGYLYRELTNIRMIHDNAYCIANNIPTFDEIDDWIKTLLDDI